MAAEMMASPVLARATHAGAVTVTREGLGRSSGWGGVGWPAPGTSSLTLSWRARVSPAAPVNT